MKIITRRKALALTAAPAFTAFLPRSTVYAQSLDSRPITLIVAYSAGSPTDLVARHMANDLAIELKQSVIVENRAGGSGTVAGNYVVRARPDGHTLYLANLPTILSPTIQAALPYKGIRDFTPIGSILSLTLALYASASVPAQNLQEFVALLKTNPGKYSYGSSGVATPAHLVGELFLQKTDTKAVHVPYKGGGEVIQGLVGDQISFGFQPLVAMQYVRSGQLKTFGVLSMKRDLAAPRVPTTDEGGIKELDKAIEFVLVATKGTPDAVADELNLAVNKVIGSESFTTKIKQMGGLSISPPRTRAQTGTFIAQQEEMWDHIVQTANIKLE